MDNHTWLELVSVLSNISMVIVGVKLVRHLSRIEFRVDTMWKVFMKEHFKTEESEEEESDEDVA